MTYRMKESVNPRTHADVMVLSHKDRVDGCSAFPYWHTRIIGIYHFVVQEKTDGGVGLGPPLQMDVLFVHWYGFDSPDGQSGWHAQQMHKVRFLPDTNSIGPAFGFLDPNAIIQMVHLILDFISDHTRELLTGQSIAIPDPRPEEEYSVYYIAI